MNSINKAVEAAYAEAPKIYQEAGGKDPTTEEEKDQFMNNTIDSAENTIRKELNVNTEMNKLSTKQREMVKLAAKQGKMPNMPMQGNKMRGGKIPEATKQMMEPPKEMQKANVKFEKLSQPQDLEHDFKAAILSTEAPAVNELPPDWKLEPDPELSEVQNFMGQHYWMQWPTKYWENMQELSNYRDMAITYKGKVLGYLGAIILDLEWTREYRTEPRLLVLWWVLARQHRNKGMGRMVLTNFLAQLFPEVKSGYTLISRRPEQKCMQFDWYFRPLQAQYLIRNKWSHPYLNHSSHPNRAKLYYGFREKPEYRASSEPLTVDQMQQLARAKLKTSKGKKAKVVKARYNVICPNNKAEWQRIQEIFDILAIYEDQTLIAVIGSLPLRMRLNLNDKDANINVVSWCYTTFDPIPDFNAVIDTAIQHWKVNSNKFFNCVSGVYWPLTGVINRDTYFTSNKFRKCHANHLVYWNTGMYAGPQVWNSPLWPDTAAI